MAQQVLSEELKKVLDGKVFVAVATIQPDGSPQVSPGVGEARR